MVITNRKTILSFRKDYWYCEKKTRNYTPEVGKKKYAARTINEREFMRSKLNNERNVLECTWMVTKGKKRKECVYVVHVQLIKKKR